ncbi:hypothetical protein WR25_19226 [Diploscapter pachys]|uniref:BBSome complex member BBS5 PH domain-containing protein n=1 Tax=Diploscapter pachys TaxID=2018661 RepID=A0A2A2KWH2_9BILA|nr:hypothetical protein WR25_19226 [Diploscapter pachys]
MHILSPLQPLSPLFVCVCHFVVDSIDYPLPSCRPTVVEQRRAYFDGDSGSAASGAAGAANGDELGEGQPQRKQPVFSDQLGLLIEPLREGFTIDDLWNVHVE